MALRDTRLPAEHFEEFIDVGQELERRRLERLQDGRTGVAAYGQHSQIVTNLLESTFAAYSMGAPIEDVRGWFLRAVDYLPHLHACRDTIPDYVQRGYGSFGSRLRWLSLAALFDLDAERCKLVIDQVTFFKKEPDPIQDRMLSWLGEPLPEEELKEVSFPIYRELWNAMNGAPSSRDAHLWTYVNDWYAKNEGTGWHDLHKGKSVTFYFGYWCIEAAAVSVWEGVDDRECRGNEYYPTALADWARLQKQKG